MCSQIPFSLKGCKRQTAIIPLISAEKVSIVNHGDGENDAENEDEIDKAVVVVEDVREIMDCDHDVR